MNLGPLIACYLGALALAYAQLCIFQAMGVQWWANRS